MQGETIPIQSRVIKLEHSGQEQFANLCDQCLDALGNNIAAFTIGRISSGGMRCNRCDLVWPTSQVHLVSVDEWKHIEEMQNVSSH